MDGFQEETYPSPPPGQLSPLGNSLPPCAGQFVTPKVASVIFLDISRQISKKMCPSGGRHTKFDSWLLVLVVTVLTGAAAEVVVDET